VRWLRVRKKVFFEGDGASRKPVSAMLAAIDITAEKNATEEIHQSEIRFRTMTESLPQMIWTSDAKGQKLFCNQRYLKYLGISSAGIVELHFEDYLHPEDRAATSARWQHCLATGEPYLQEYRMRRHDGIYRHFIARALPTVNDHGVIDRWLGSITDIHDQKLAEEALRQSEKLSTAGRLAASIAHEINNPLAAVTNSIYLALQDKTLNSDTRAFLEMADQELARVAHITTQSLKFHKQSVSPEDADLGSLMRSALALFAPRFKSKQMTVRVEAEPGTSVRCLGDDVRQVFTNLLSNSLDATADQGRIRIRIRKAHAWTGDRTPGVRIVIGDTGSGVPAAIRQRIFEPFISTKLETGIGLGLWISDAIVKKHNGRVHLRSSTAHARHGTVISLFLPADGLTVPLSRER
jgi:PAS domain S-box-containing protein